MHEIIYDKEVRGHLAAIDRKYHGLIRETIEQQLRHEPTVETRNRKPLGVPTETGATWEIRFGSGNRFRVFYCLDERDRVVVLAIGIEVRNHLLIGGREVRL